jgi:phospholipid-binding lipoprotein MlaA
VFAFNDAVDRAALKPAATAYKKVLPGFVQSGVNNFFGNLSDIWSGANNLLQGKGHEGVSDLARVALNSTIGLLGVVDVASTAGLEKHNEDFGQTLGAWGMPAGPYLMLPLLGPSTVRDATVLPLDMAADPWSHKEPVNWRNVGIGVRAIDQRASILDASNLMEEAALDRYEFIRDGFLQRRDSRIYDTDKLRQRKEDKDAAADAKAEAAGQAAGAEPAPAAPDAPAAGDAAASDATAPAGGATPAAAQPADAQKHDDTTSVSSTPASH